MPEKHNYDTLSCSNRLLRVTNASLKSKIVPNGQAKRAVFPEVSDADGDLSCQVEMKYSLLLKFYRIGGSCL